MFSEKCLGIRAAALFEKSFSHATRWPAGLYFSSSVLLPCLKYATSRNHFRT